MTSPEVMWTFLRTPCVTALVGDSCVVGPEGKEIGILEVGVGEEIKCEKS
jgi:hypothetical protein